MTTTIESAATTIRTPRVEFEVDQAQLAAISFLARYSARTLEAYRHDLRGFLQWATDQGIAVLAASRAHIELFRAWMEDRGLAASTIDRRLSTVCGFYRFAHIDGRIRSNPAQYVRRPQVHPSDARALDRSELGVFLFTAEQCDRDHAALAVLLGLNGLRVSEACATNIEDLGFERGHRTLRIVGKGNKPATVPLVPRTARTIDRAVGERHEGPILRRRDGQRLDRRTAHRWIRSIGKRAGLGAVNPHMLRAAFIILNASGDCLAWRVVGEPLDDGRHVLLEGSRSGEVQDARALGAAVLEVVGHAARYQDERALGRVDPAVADLEGHGPVDDVEHVVLGMGVGPGAGGVRLQPPLRDGVPAGGLGAVRLEHRFDPAHVVAAALAGRELNRTSRLVHCCCLHCSGE